MKEDARRNWRRRKQQTMRLARREYFKKKNEAQTGQARPTLVSGEVGTLLQAPLQ